MNDLRRRSEFTLVVLLFVEAGAAEEFEEFERQASKIMARHGGRIEQRMKLRSDGGPSEPNELHIVVFPDREAFDRYRNDPDTHSLKKLRDRIIRRTEIWEASRIDAPSG